MTVHEKIINAVERAQTMEKAIEVLRGYGFRFYEGTLLFPKEITPEVYYSWMIRYVDKKSWDKSLIFGIKLWRKKTRKIFVRWRKGKVTTTTILKKHWKDEEDINFKRSVITLRFPDYLDYDQRRKWRTEHHKQVRNPDREPSKWYLKVLPDVKFLEKHEQRVAHG